MIEKHDPLLIAYWSENLDQLDHEIARLAFLCQVKILDHGVIERVIKKDASVCGTDNPIAFAKLHNLLMMHFVLRERSVESLGQTETAQIEAHIVERLRRPFGDLVGKWPPA